MEDILYTYGKNLYVNLTNRCPCNCTFCIRSQKQGLGSAETLWLDHDPSADEVIAAFQAYRLEVFEELIFCGYGEPFCALDNMLAVYTFCQRYQNSCQYQRPWRPDQRPRNAAAADWTGRYSICQPERTGRTVVFRGDTSIFRYTIV